jgi:hypothetical protein
MSALPGIRLVPILTTEIPAFRLFPLSKNKFALPFHGLAQGLKGRVREMARCQSDADP